MWLQKSPSLYNAACSATSDVLTEPCHPKGGVTPRGRGTEVIGIDRVSEGLHGGLGRNLADLLSVEEIASLAARCARLHLPGRFPAPSGELPAVPWPLF
jgi:hypothetical protein